MTPGTVAAVRDGAAPLPTGRPLVPVNAKLAAHVAAQIQGEREQSDLFFEALRRMLPPTSPKAAPPLASNHIKPSTPELLEPLEPLEPSNPSNL